MPQKPKATKKPPEKAKTKPTKAPVKLAESSKVSSKGAHLKAYAFKPGQSGNPGGRQKQDKSLKALAREHTADAIQTLADILKNTAASESSRVQAASALLDRGWGKPLQQLEIGEAGAFSEMDEDAVDAFIASAMVKLKDATVAGHA